MVYSVICDCDVHSDSERADNLRRYYARPVSSFNSNSTIVSCMGMVLPLESECTRSEVTDVLAGRRMAYAIGCHFLVALPGFHSALGCLQRLRSDPYPCCLWMSAAELVLLRDVASIQTRPRGSRLFMPACITTQ